MGCPNPTLFTEQPTKGNCLQKLKYHLFFFRHKSLQSQLARLNPIMQEVAQARQKINWVKSMPCSPTERKPNCTGNAGRNT